MVRRFLCCLVLLLTAFSLWAEPNARSYLFVLDNGQIIAEKGQYEQRPMASTTKLMTALLASEAKWDELEIDFDITQELYPNLGLKKGDRLKRKDAVTGMLLPSSNELAVAAARRVGGSERAFAAMMNRRAAGLGMIHTNYRNPHGLDASGHYSCCRDIFILAGEVMKHSELRDIICLPKAEIEVISRGGRSRKIKPESTFKWFLESVPGACGMKTGTTTNAGSCFVGAVKCGEHYLYGILLNTGKTKAYTVAAKEYSDIAKEYSLKTVVNKGDAFQADKDFDRIMFTAADSCELLLKDGERFSITMVYEPKYPVKKGDKAAVLKITAPGYSGTVELTAAEDRIIPNWQMVLSAAFAVTSLAGTAGYFLF